MGSVLIDNYLKKNFDETGKIDRYDARFLSYKIKKIEGKNVYY